MERMSLYFLFVLCLWYLMPCQCTTGKATTGCHGLFEFTCDDGQCVAVSQKCDGRQDCLDNSDERYCTSSTLSPGSTTSTPALTCRNGEVLVKNCTNKGRSHCLPFLWLCDGSSDCITDRDEVNCTATKNTTSKTTVNSTTTVTNSPTATVNSTTTTANSRYTTISKPPALRVTSPTTLTKVLPASTTSSMAKGSTSTSGIGSPVATVSTPAATATATVNSTTTTTNSPTTTSDSRSTTSKLPATRVTSPTTLTKVLPASTTSSMAKGSSSTSGIGSPVATVSTPAATATATVNSTTTTTNSPTTTSDSRSTTSKLPATRVTSPTTLTKVLPASTTSSMAKGSSSTSGNRINPSKHTDVQRRRHEPSSLAIELGASFTAAVAIGILLLVICKMCRRQKVNIVICTQPGLQGSTITLQEFV